MVCANVAHDMVSFIIIAKLNICDLPCIPSPGSELIPYNFISCNTVKLLRFHTVSYN